MISAVSSASPVSQAYQAQNTPPAPAKPAASKPASQPQDTVHIIRAAQSPAKPSGDVDHDGDSK
jgi:hypothetical protein